MRWLDASWSRKLIGARMRCYINYTGCPSVIVLTLNLLNSRSSLVHLLLACTLIHQSLDTCHLALSALRILTFSPFLGQRQSSVRARSVLLRRPFLIISSGHQINRQHICVLLPIKDVLLPQCLQSTLATSSAPQIQHILLTLRA